MANWIDYYLSVLAQSTAEIKAIEARLDRPSHEFVHGLVARLKEDSHEIAHDISTLVSFKPVKNLFNVHDSVNKARKFHNQFKRGSGIVDSHIAEVSHEFPSALFMLEYFDMQASYSGKRIILDGQVLHEVYDGNQRAQGIDWALVNIFAPFRAEYDLGLPFGSLWDEWLADMSRVVTRLADSCIATSTDVANSIRSVPEGGESSRGRDGNEKEQVRASCGRRTWNTTNNESRS